MSKKTSHPGEPRCNCKTSNFCAASMNTWTPNELKGWTSKMNVKLGVEEPIGMCETVAI